MSIKKLLSAGILTLSVCARSFAAGEVEFEPIPIPTGLTASDGTSAEKVTVSWQEVPDASYYVLTRNGVGVNASARTEWTVYKTSFDDTTAVAGLVYNYRVQAVDAIGQTSSYSAYESGWRQVSLAVDGLSVVVPSAAKSTSVKATGTIRVKCNTSWTASPATDDDAWILPDSSTAIADGDGLLRIGAAENTTGAIRRGRVKVASRGTNVFFTVIQGSAGGTDEIAADALDSYARIGDQTPTPRAVTFQQQFASGFAIAPSGLGTTCLRTGPMTAGESAAVCVEVSGKGELVFNWKRAPGADPSDTYQVDITTPNDDFRSSVALPLACTATEWTETKITLAGPGPHYVTWTYVKNADTPANQGGAYLDNVQFLGLPVSLELTLSSTILSGGTTNSVEAIMTDTFGQKSVVHPHWWYKSHETSVYQDTQGSYKPIVVVNGSPETCDYITSGRSYTSTYVYEWDLKAVYTVDLGGGETSSVEAFLPTITDLPPVSWPVLRKTSDINNPAPIVDVNGSWRYAALATSHYDVDSYINLNCAAVADVGGTDVADEMSFVTEPGLLRFHCVFENPDDDTCLEFYVNDETTPRRVIAGKDYSGSHDDAIWKTVALHFEQETEAFRLRYRFVKGSAADACVYVDKVVRNSPPAPLDDLHFVWTYGGIIDLAWRCDTVYYAATSYRVEVFKADGTFFYEDKVPGEGTTYLHYRVSLPTGTYTFVVTPSYEFTAIGETIEGLSDTLTATVSAATGPSCFDVPGLSFETDGENAWSAIFLSGDQVTDDSDIDGMGLQSAPIGMDASSTLRAQAVGPGRIEFRYQASCGYYDRLKLRLNGELVEEIDSTREASPLGGPDIYVWRDYAIELPYGTNTVEWVFEKPWTSDTSPLPTGCEDCCRVREIAYVPYAFTGEAFIDGRSVIAAGAAPGVFTFYAQYEDDKGNVADYVVPLDENGWSCEASDPFAGASVSSEILSDGTLAVTVADDLMFTGYVVISAAAEIDGAGQSDQTYCMVQQITADDALNGSGTELAYTIRHDDTWKVTLEEGPPGGKGMCLEAAAARSTVSWSDREFCTTVTGCGTLSFQWAKSSYESGSGYLQFRVNGAVKEELTSGGTGWQTVEVKFEDDGPHALTWTYYDVYDYEDDFCYVGDIKWTPSETAYEFVEGVIEGSDSIGNEGDKGSEYVALLIYRVGDELVTNFCYNAVWDADGAVNRWGDVIEPQRGEILTLQMRNTSETNETVNLSIAFSVDGGTYTAEKTVTVVPYLDPLAAVSDQPVPLRLMNFTVSGFAAEKHVVHAGKTALSSDRPDAYVEFAVIGAGRFSFDWKSDCSEKSAALILESEWMEVSRISGANDWTTYELVIDEKPENPGQYHWITLRYESSDAVGADAGYLDNFVWQPDPCGVPLKTALLSSWPESMSNAVVTTGGDAFWEPLHTGGGGYQAAYNCTNGGTSATASIQVRGAGKVGFSYRIGGATDGTIVFKVDDVTVRTLTADAEVNDYVEYEVTGDGDHTLEWVAEGFATSDDVTLFNVNWDGEFPVPDGPAKIATDDGVPYAWLIQYGIDQGGDRWETAQYAKAANGVNTVRECYLLKLNPTNETSTFTASIDMSTGEPVVTWSPDRSDEPSPPVTYEVEGKASLSDKDWAPKSSEHRFFRVKVTEVK